MKRLKLQPSINPACPESVDVQVKDKTVVKPDVEAWAHFLYKQYKKHKTLARTEKEM